MRLAIALATLLVLGTCQLEGEGAPRLGDAVQRVEQHMHARFAAVHEAELSLVFGDLARARASAARVADVDEPDALPAWRPYIDEVRGAARQVAGAPDAIAAGKGLALVAARCAHCHAAIGARVVFPAEPLPAGSGARLAPQMARHGWAATQMWEGLVGPSDDRWLAGARELAGAPLAITAESSQLGIADDVAQIRVYAARALKPASLDDRATLYGQMLATCVHCHAQIRDR